MNVNVRAIAGNWDAGFALDKHMAHSEYIGDDEHGHARFNNTRTEIGQALYELKHNGHDFSKVEPLAEALAQHIVPLLPQIGLVIPMPASNPRARQPVTEIAQAVGRIIGQPVFENMLSKTANGQQLKDLNTKAEKQAALQGSFSLHESITNEGRWNALIIDDLYHTGASLEAACATLRGYRKIDKIFVAAVTWR